MLQIHSANCSPIKPHNNKSFGRNEVLTATVDWLENVDTSNINEDNFNGLGNLSEKMHDGPLKTFVKILGIAGTAFFAAKAGASKAVKKLAGNKVISKNVALPLTKFVKTTLGTAQKTLKNSPHFGADKKGFKSYFVNTSVKLLEELEAYGKKGASELVKNLDAQISELKSLQNASNKESIKSRLSSLAERKKLASTENLITKLTTNTIGASAGTVAIVEANKDRNKNGVPDIGEHN